MNEVLRSAIYGLAVGDALGVPYEFKRRGSFECTGMVGYGTHNQPAGTWSDDTSMTLATCHSIKQLGGVSVENIRLKFKDWLYRGRYAIDGKVFDVGNTTAMAIETGEGLDGEHSQGNGSLMRILPLAFVENGEKYIKEVSAITHAHDKPIEICREYIEIARRIINGAGVCNEVLKEIHMHDIHSSGYVASTFTAAIWCLVNTNGYKDAVLQAVNLGDDTDTTAAVTGGLAGIMYGYDAIPKEWIETLRGKEIIDACLF